MTKVLHSVLLVLAGSSLVQGAILTVGPDGTYTTIQQAIDAAVVGQTNDIRAQGGGRSFIENIRIPSSFSSGTIDLTGGWDATFTVRDPDPEASILEGQDTVRPLDIRLSGGTFTLDGFTVRNGVIFGDGGGIRVWPGGDSVVTLKNLRMLSNLAIEAATARGGAIYAELDGSEQLFLENLRIRDNEAESTGGGQVFGGGLFIYLAGNASVEIDDVEIDGNTIRSSGAGLYGGGLYLVAHEDSAAQFTFFHIFANSAIGPDIYSSGADLTTTGSASVTFLRSSFALNTAIGDSASQLRSIQSASSSLLIRDSGVARSDHSGMVFLATDSSQIHLANLSVADNATAGLTIVQQDTSTVTLYNSISFDNGTDLVSAGTLDADFNLIGVDPQFVNPDDLDYHLRPGSPALDAGTNTPPGGLSSTDFDGNPRILNSVVDIGMYEGVTLIFEDGFESGSTDLWSLTMP